MLDRDQAARVRGGLSPSGRELVAEFSPYRLSMLTVLHGGLSFFSFCPLLLSILTPF